MVALLGVLLPPQAAANTCPSADELTITISLAEGHYVRRQYEEVTELLDVLLSPEVCFLTDQQTLDARLLLGVSLFQLGELGLAELEFLALLRMDPDYQLDGVIPVPRAASSYLEQVRATYEEELRELRALRGGGEGVVVETIYVTVEERHNQLWINFLPFGAGQFQNDQPGWGAAYAATQGLGLVANVAGFSMSLLVQWRGGDQVANSPAEREEAENWQMVQMVGLGAFGLVYVASVTHALLEYEATSSVLLPPSREKPDAPGADEDGIAFLWGLAPLTTPDGGGVLFLGRW